MMVFLMVCLLAVLMVGVVVVEAIARTQSLESVAIPVLVSEKSPRYLGRHR